MMNGRTEGMDDNELRSAFTLFDVNRDGRIAASELMSVLEFLRIQTSREEVDQMIRDADADGNGTVDFDEFLQMMQRYSENQLSKSPKSELREAFNVFDHNRDGFVDFEEIKRTMHFLGQAVTDDEVRGMIKAADRDHDGLVNFEEFQTMMDLARSRESHK